ncbi:hypothetical protein UY3_14240 [Chelonia mydas]|uniref:Uncharacterized protein n=1 Tax=Chelonia mydas TaxID=8469 RepID=M7AZU0_CHEMY|nr:hypothetical protein UY3_14240 [Chelonia mydas]
MLPARGRAGNDNSCLPAAGAGPDRLPAAEKRDEHPQPPGEEAGLCMQPAASALVQLADSEIYGPQTEREPQVQRGTFLRPVSLAMWTQINAGSVSVPV